MAKENNVPKQINELSEEIYHTSQKRGYYNPPVNIGEKLCLIHSEVSEALEADRKERYAATNINAVNGWIGDESFFKGYEQYIKGTFEEEMADIFIRLMDLCGYKGVNIAEHVQAKLRYNEIKGVDSKKKY